MRARYWIGGISRNNNSILVSYKTKRRKYLPKIDQINWVCMEAICPFLTVQKKRNKMKKQPTVRHPFELKRFYSTLYLIISVRFICVPFELAFLKPFNSRRSSVEDDTKRAFVLLLFKVTASILSYDISRTNQTTHAKDVYSSHCYFVFKTQFSVEPSY